MRVRILLAAACLAPALVSVARAQDAAAPTGVVPPGQLEVQCPDAACTLQVSGVPGSVPVPAGRGVALPKIPAGPRTVAAQVGGQQVQADVQVCGNVLRLRVTASGIAPRGAAPDPCPAIGFLTVTAPGKATVRIGTTDVAGAAATRVPVYAGDVPVVVRQDGYEDFVATATVTTGTLTTVAAVLAPLPASLILTGVPPDLSALTVDDTPVVADGEAQPTDLRVVLSDGRIEMVLPPGDHRVHAERPDHRPLDLRIQLDTGADVTRALDFQPLPARVTFDVWPPNAQLQLDGRAVTAKAGEAVSVAADVQHTVTAAASGYEPGRETFTARPNEARTVAIRLVGREVSLNVQGVPAGAQVALDGEAPQDAGTILATRAGKHVLTVEAAGYAPFRQEIEVSTELVQTVEVTLEKLARLTLEVEPSGADVRVDGSAAPPTSGGLELSAGEHTVEVSADGFEPARRGVTLAAGEESALAVRLTPIPARVTLDGLPEDARVTLDGLPATLDGDTLVVAQPGEHTVTVSSPTVQAQTVSVTTDPGGEASVALAPFAVRPARVTMLGLPDGAKLKVDDRPVTDYTGPLELEPGRHQIWLAAEGYVRQVLDLTVRAGQELELRPDLRPLPSSN